MANPRKPSHLKAIHGTQQKCRMNPNEPVASDKLPVPLEYLSEVQVEKFASILAIVNRMQIASADHVNALAALAVVTCEIEDDVVLLATLGSPYYVPNKESGIIRSHPAVARLTANRQRAQAMWNEFGLTPASMSKVTVAPIKADNPFARLEGKRGR